MGTVSNCGSQTWTCIRITCRLQRRANDPLGLQFISGKFPGHDNAVIWEPHFGTTKNPDEKIL